MHKIFIPVIFLLTVSSCKQHHNGISLNGTGPKVFKSIGHVVPDDSLSEPEVVFAGKPVVKKAGNPRIVSIAKNIHHAKIPVSVIAGEPKICTPGRDNFLVPAATPAIGASVPAGMPEVVIAKEAYIKENNPQSFSSFGKLQGLNTNSVYCITQDEVGNLWFGTAGGITRYDGNSFSIYSYAQGLDDNTVLSILHDKNNNLWLGTKSGGICRFDGKNFTHFYPDNGLPLKNVSSIMEDNEGNLWFGSMEGAVKYDGKTFTSFTERSGLVNNMVFSICEDDRGDIWFGTAGGASRYDGNSFSNFTVSEGLCNDQVRSVYQDKSGGIWFGTAGGVTKYDGRSFTDFSGKEDLRESAVFTILEDRDGNLWFGTWGEGVYKYDGKFFAHFTEEEGLINNEIYCIFQDRKGILWFGTRAGGISKYNGDFFSHFSNKDGVISTQVQCILQDKKGNLWFGTWGGGVCKYDGKSFIYYTEKEGLINDDVRSIIEDRDGNLWFGTWGGLSKFDGKTFTQYTEKERLSDNVIISMLQDESGNLWFGTEGKGVIKYDGKHFVHFDRKEGLSGSIVRSMLLDKNSNIWFVTDHGVTRYIPGVRSVTGKGSFTHFTLKEGFPTNNIISVMEDRQGNIWFGSSGEGVFKYNGDQFTQFTVKDGLCDNGVRSCMESRNGNLWFGTRTGISRLVKDPEMPIASKRKKDKGPRPVLFKNYTYDDGFYGVGCNSNAICEDENGAIWIGANDRLTVFNPNEKRTYDDTIAPNIQLTGIDLFFEKVPWRIIKENNRSGIVLHNGIVLQNIKFDSLSEWYSIPENLNLPYNDNFLTFNFIGITTRSPQSVRYQYNLTGLNQEWSSVTDQTSASYGHLPDGHYTFRVRAMNGEGFMSKEFIYDFTIRPPWWKTNWAFLLYTLAFISGIIFVDRIQTARVVAKEREKTRERELEHARAIEKAYHELHLKNEIVERQKNEIELEKKHSDKLLLNILPLEVAMELKSKGFADAKYYSEVTVLFTDFKDFTFYSERVSPQKLVAEIHECFSMFDQIMEKHKVEKIKTIGDSYMAAGGIPTPNKSHAIDVVNAALEIQEFMFERKIMKESVGEYFMEIRIGIHTGPVVAGIVGKKKFAYDIWGDTVNTASQIERSCEVGRVNISRTTYNMVMNEVNCEYRGKINTKNKGPLDMYYANC